MKYCKNYTVKSTIVRTNNVWSCYLKTFVKPWDNTCNIKWEKQKQNCVHNKNKTMKKTEIMINKYHYPEIIPTKTLLCTVHTCVYTYMCMHITTYIHVHVYKYKHQYTAILIYTH